MNDIGYENLGIAVIRMAAVDYKKALHELQKNPTHCLALATKKECEDFFRNRLNNFTNVDIDGEYIINHFQNEIMMNFTKRKRR